ncbi:hypothetical protein AMTRI_Chr08g206240 [Amborella trichopoda]
MDAIAQEAAEAMTNKLVPASMADTSMKDLNASSFPPASALASESPIIDLDEYDVIPSLKTQATAKSKGKRIISHKPTRSSYRLAARCTIPRSMAGGISFRVTCNEDLPLVNSSSYSSIASIEDGGFDGLIPNSYFYEDH